MEPNLLAALPEWFRLGLTLGGVLAVLVAAVFLLGDRLFPDAADRGPRGDAGEGRRRGEIRTYLRSIGEPFVEDRSVAGQPVAFYLPDRNVAITFDARAFFRLERAGVHAVLVEHEMPVSHLGWRLPFETPEVATPAQSGTDDAFATLGLPADATGDEVTRAYRERVKAVHPDHGGDPEAFARVREAYTIARRRAG